MTRTKKLSLFLLFAALILFMTTGSFAQTKGGAAVNATHADPDSTAMLDVSSVTKGILIPRMTEAERNAISGPAPSLLIFQTDETPGFYYNAGTALAPNWTQLGGGVAGTPAKHAGYFTSDGY
jgi:hypothetical protein